jgi:hypothetical protein
MLMDISTINIWKTKVDFIDVVVKKVNTLLEL